MSMEIKQLKCLRCGHAWFPRQFEVRICPHCKSAYWNKERRQKKKEEIDDSIDPGVRSPTS